jgi:hypothetical protein
MGKIAGKDQASLYVDPELHTMAKLLATRKGMKFYELFEEALRTYVHANTTPKERKAMSAFFSEKKEGKE